MPIRVSSLYRYPVKGLSPEPLPRVALEAGECAPQDRRFAIARPEAKFDPQNPQWLPKANFVMLMRDEALARLNTSFDEATGELGIGQDGRPRLSARITSPEGRAAAERFFAEFMGGSLKGAPRIVEAPGHSFADARRRPNAATGKYVSIVNLASVRALEQAIGAPLDPLRFRANVYLDGAPAWAELGWVDSEITVGEVRLHVVSPTTRCAATNVNPATAERDMDIPAALRSAFGHNQMGVYAEVLAGGTINPGDMVTADKAP